jgi:hypothetical protein
MKVIMKLLAKFVIKTKSRGTSEYGNEICFPLVEVWANQRVRSEVNMEDVGKGWIESGRPEITLPDKTNLHTACLP